MSEIADRYRRLSDAFAGKIAAVPGDRWDAQTPCEEWTARDLVGHVVDTQRMFLGFIGKELGEIPSVDDDPRAAWDAARARVQAVLDDPQQATTEFQGMTGTSTFEAGVNRFLCTDLVVHGWDLARTAGLDENIDPHDLATVKRDMEAMGDTLRGPRAFGPAIEPPPDADEQQRVLAFLGRRA